MYVVTYEGELDSYVLSAEALTKLGESGQAVTFDVRTFEYDPNCPTCNSPSPRLHPAMQFEGEVQRCKDPWHVRGADPTVRHSEGMDV